MEERERERSFIFFENKCKLSLVFIHHFGLFFINIGTLTQELLLWGFWMQCSAVFTIKYTL